MATTQMTLSALLMALISSATAQNNFPLINQDLLVATEEMQISNYFTFVMLMNMAPGSLSQGNVTFLMPNDRILAQTLMPENGVVDFLLHHSIPSPLLFEHLVQIPTGSVLPTAKPEFVLEISNHGSRSFYLNNVRIISPDICTKGFSIRCHGVDGVVQAATMVPGHTTTPPLPPPPSGGNSSSSPVAVASPPPAASWPSPAPPAGGFNLVPLLNAPPPSPSDQNGRPLKSGSSPFGGLPLGLMITCLIFLRHCF